MEVTRATARKNRPTWKPRSHFTVATYPFPSANMRIMSASRAASWPPDLALPPSPDGPRSGVCVRGSTSNRSRPRHMGNGACGARRGLPWSDVKLHHGTAVCAQLRPIYLSAVRRNHSWPCTTTPSLAWTGPDCLTLVFSSLPQLVISMQLRKRIQRRR